MPEVRTIDADRVQKVIPYPDGKVKVTFRERPDGTKRNPLWFRCIEDYLAKVVKTFEPSLKR